MLCVAPFHRVRRAAGVCVTVPDCQTLRPAAAVCAVTGHLGIIHDEVWGGLCEHQGLLQQWCGLGDWVYDEHGCTQARTALACHSHALAHSQRIDSSSWHL